MGVLFGTPNLALSKIAITELLTAIACFFLSAEISAPKDLPSGQTNAR